MRKVLVTIIVLLCISCSFVFADGDVYSETSAGVIEYDSSSNTLSLNNYTHDSSIYSYNDGISDWAIYAEGDLTINLTGTNIIDDSIGIYVSGNLQVTGSGTLEVCELVIDGESFVSEAQIYLNNGTSSYIGPKIHYPMSVFYLDSSFNKKFPKYCVDGTYRDFDNNDLTNITFYPMCEKANLDNLYKDSPIYRYNTNTSNWDIETENVNGFVIYESNVGTTVEYDPTGVLHDKDAPVYDVTFYEDLSSSIPKIKYIELAFKESEWGKTLGYEVLSSTNSYEYRLVNNVPTFNPFVVGNTYYEVDGFVAERSIYDDGLGNRIGSAFYAFGITKNNNLSVKVLGESSYVYININVYDTHNYPDHDPYYVIPNTGIK